MSRDHTEDEHSTSGEPRSRPGSPDRLPGSDLAAWSSSSGLSPDAQAEDLGPGIVSTQALEPGYYWTARDRISDLIPAGETLLLLEVHEVHGKVHTVDLLMHPRTGREGKHSMLVDEFLANFDPEPDADRIRAQEQQAVLTRVSDIQEEMARTQADPQLMIAAVSEEVERRIKEADREAQHHHDAQQRQHREKASRLDKIHRRAARRSAAAGNPLVVARASTGTNLANYIAAGVNESGVAALREAANRQVIVAGAQAKWLQAKTEEITKTLKMLAPYAAEKAQVALARSSGAIKRARSIEQGIQSLDLYTLKNVDVFDVCVGAPASSSEPLTLVQGKRFQDEELAVYAEVSKDYDYTSQQQFFNALRDDHRLVDQLFPTPRCVVSMAVTRKFLSYENPFESMMANQANQRVYLMVRNGANVHVVYSGTPSHEAAGRLFPTEDELGGVFTGIDGTKLSLRDVEFSKATATFDNLQLHYKRFLILLCGLDHQHKLFGDFYPAQKSLSFMSLAFQQQYMRFYADEEHAHLLTHQKHPWVADYLREKNLAVQPGSRVFIAPNRSLRDASPELARRSRLRVAKHHSTDANIVSREGLRLYLNLETQDIDKYDAGPTVKAYLDSAQGSNMHVGMLEQSWWICIDDVKAADLHAYIHSRRNRAVGVDYLRLFKRLHEHLVHEEACEAPARAYLLEQATSLGGLPLEVARPAVEAAVRNWRAARRGRDLPGIDDLAELNTVLDLVIPEGYVPDAVKTLIDEHVMGLASFEEDSADAPMNRQPLLLTRAGRNRFHLYTTPNAADRDDYPDVLPFQWARRVALEPTKTVRSLKVVSEALVWLPKVIPASESVIQEWPQLKDWQHEQIEPIRLRKYAEIKKNIADAAQVWGPILKAGAGAGIEPSVFDALLQDCAKRHRSNTTSVRKYNYLALPVGIQRHTQGLATIYMMQGAERVLHAYGDEAQRAAVQRMLSEKGRWYQRSIDEYLKIKMEWRLCSSTKELDLRHDDVLRDAPDVESCDWAKLPVRENHKTRGAWHFGQRGNSRKGDGKPSLRDTAASLSLNHAVNELMGVSSLNTRAHRRKTARDILSRSLWFDYPKWLNDLRNGSDVAAFEAGKRRWLHERRQEPFKGFRPANLSPLLWDETMRRGVGNAHFVAPLRDKAVSPAERQGQASSAAHRGAAPVGGRPGPAPADSPAPASETSQDPPTQPGLLQAALEAAPMPPLRYGVADISGEGADANLDAATDDDADTDVSDQGHMRMRFG